MKIFDTIKNEIKENDNKKKFDKAKENAKNNLTQENRDKVRYLFASFFGLAGLLALSVSFYKLFAAYFFVGLSLCPIIYHNKLTENVSTYTIRIIEISVPIFILLIIVFI